MTILAYDCDFRPIHEGDIVEWLYDNENPKLQRRVLGLADSGRAYPPLGPERGYVRVESLSDDRGYQQRFGMNLRRLWDEDLEMDEGL